MTELIFELHESLFTSTRTDEHNREVGMRSQFTETGSMTRAYVHTNVQFNY